MKKKLQIFISSTYTDLKEERQAAVSAILRAGHIPAGMELFAAGNISQMETIKWWINDSDIFMLILGGRYGSIEKTTGLSYTELEYDYAVEIGKPFFAVVIEDGFLNKKIKDRGRDALEQDHPNKLKDFKEKVLNKICRTFEDLKDIQLTVQETISDFEHRYDLKGWIHADEIKKLNIESISFEKEKKTLQDQLQHSKTELRNLKNKFDSYRNISINFENPHKKESDRKILPKIITAKPGDYKLIKITGGTFMMGSPKIGSENPLHEVTVPDFYIGQYPVTNKEYEIFLKENSYMDEPEYWTNSAFNQPDQPVVGVHWDDAKEYAEWSGLRLPTEAEWEYACRAGTNTLYYTGDTKGSLDKAGWHSNNSFPRTRTVGQKKPNSFGLYDMHGNVWEWCEDDHHGNYKDAPNDASAWVDSPRGSRRVVRGGSWCEIAPRCQSAIRYCDSPDLRSFDFGFRLTRSGTLVRPKRSEES